MRLGALLLGRRPVERIVELAQLVEARGFDTVWVPDERFFRDSYLLCGAVAQATERIQLGPGVTDPFTRHPAITASAMATLDELSHGRAVLGIGAGVSGFRELGLERRRPALAVAEAVQLVRELLRGAHTSFHGQVVRFDGRLDFMPQRPELPIYVAAGGPKMHAVAGQLGDGAIIGSCLSRYVDLLWRWAGV